MHNLPPLERGWGVGDEVGGLLVQLNKSLRQCVRLQEQQRHGRTPAGSPASAAPLVFTAANQAPDRLFTVLLD